MPTHSLTHSLTHPLSLTHSPLLVLPLCPPVPRSALSALFTVRFCPCSCRHVGGSYSDRRTDRQTDSVDRGEVGDGRAQCATWTGAGAYKHANLVREHLMVARAVLRVVCAFGSGVGRAAGPWRPEAHPSRRRWPRVGLPPRGRLSRRTKRPEWTGRQFCLRRVCFSLDYSHSVSKSAQHGMCRSCKPHCLDSLWAMRAKHIYRNMRQTTLPVIKKPFSPPRGGRDGGAASALMDVKKERGAIGCTFHS